MSYRTSLPAHAGLLRDVIGQLVPPRQIRSNAHPLVEMTLMRQGSRTLLHLINLSGHSQTGYFDPIPMRDIRIELAGNFRSAQSIRQPSSIALNERDGYTGFVIPDLKDYELIVLE